jgi:hypothetical protein
MIKQTQNIFPKEYKYSNMKQVVSYLEKLNQLGSHLEHTQKQLEVEYALRIANKPIGVSNYTLSKQLPNEFKGKLPTSEQFKHLL